MFIFSVRLEFWTARLKREFGIGNESLVDITGTKTGSSKPAGWRLYMIGPTKVRYSKSWSLNCGGEVWWDSLGGASVLASRLRVLAFQGRCPQGSRVSWPLRDPFPLSELGGR